MSLKPETMREEEWQYALDRLRQTSRAALNELKNTSAEWLPRDYSTKIKNLELLVIQAESEGGDISVGTKSALYSSLEAAKLAIGDYHHGELRSVSDRFLLHFGTDLGQGLVTLEHEFQALQVLHDALELALLWARTFCLARTWETALLLPRDGETRFGVTARRVS